ncbi:beta-fg-like protein [Agaricus bisporus var. bisporus H97]|uniref:beta-fg-like protein n=1 Tax=Agaricus bisporus var. bisporus (strain H97 / ATCC MYA-4626 / FGSC 10389) TaxID=936046 RepID=UPI00029F6970|nr:beta-fg-like protein [Agaricus bisporus var. bisporus H97]EKV51092.1 beta-fg-like protein [Agaricus bisporus var. bisporus H97]
MTPNLELRSVKNNRLLKLATLISGKFSKSRPLHSLVTFCYADTNKTVGDGRNAPQSTGHPQSGVNKTGVEGHNAPQTYGHPQSGVNKAGVEGHNVLQSQGHPQSGVNKTGVEGHNTPQTYGHPQTGVSNKTGVEGHNVLQSHGHPQTGVNKTGVEGHNAPQTYGHPQTGVNQTGVEGHNAPQLYDHPQSDANKLGGEGYNAPHPSGQSGHGQYGHPQRLEVKDIMLLFTLVKVVMDHTISPNLKRILIRPEVKDITHLILLVVLNKAEEPLDEGELTRAHDNIYSKNDSRGITAQLLGSAAALNVIKKFAGESGSSGYGTGHGGNTQSQLISMAMTEAVKLFDQSGGQVLGNKQDAVNGAAVTVMKLLVKSNFSGSGTIGGKDSGGLGSLRS